MSNSMEPVLRGLYVEKVGDNWRINHPDGTCFDGPFKSKGAATRALNDWKSEITESVAQSWARDAST